MFHYLEHLGLFYDSAKKSSIDFGGLFLDFRSNGTPDDVENGKPMVSPLESDLGMVENRPMSGIFQSDLGHFGEKTALDISAKTNID